MCSECWYTVGHATGCPNAPDPKPVHECKKCGYGIFPEDKFYDSDEGPICEDCMNEMSTSEILELIGEELTTAQYPDPPEYED